MRSWIERKTDGRKSERGGVGRRASCGRCRSGTALRQINANDQSKASTVTATLWYAPSINRWVRKTNKTQIEGRLRDSHTEELTDYSRKP